MMTEREFLHELASPLAAAICCVDSLLADVKEQAASNAETVEELSEIFASLAKLKDLMTSRRAELHKRDAK